MSNIFAFSFVPSGLGAVTYTRRVEDILSNLHRCNCESYEEDCLIKAIQSMRPHLAIGVEKLGISTFIPYVLENGYYKLFLSNRKSSFFLLKNIQLGGLYDFYISQLKVLRYLSNMEIVIHFPIFILRADAFRNGPTLTSPLDESASKYYERINHEFINTTIYAKVSGYKLPSFASGNLQHFSLSNIHMTWKITEVEEHIDYFKFGKYTTALSTRTFSKTQNEWTLNLPHHPVQDEVLDDLSYYIRKDFKTMLDKLPLEMLCLH